MSTTPSQAEIDRAFAIADESMFAQLERHCRHLDEFGVCLLPVDHEGRTVPSFADAEEPIRDAFDWCCARGYVEILEDDSGQYIWVNRRPGEDLA